MTGGAYHVSKGTGCNGHWIMVRVFPKTANQPKEMALTICNLVFCYCLLLMGNWNWETVQMERKFLLSCSSRIKRRTCGGVLTILAKKTGNFCWKSNGTVIFRKICSKIVDYLQRKSSFSIQNGTSEIFLPFSQFPSSSLSSTENNNRKPNFKW